MTRPPPPPRAPVREREVLYFAGFDPRGSRGYHQLYRAQAALQAGVGGLPVQVGPRQRAASGFEDWELRADTPSGEVLAHYRFMGWDDIVRLHWSRGGWRLLMDSLKANAFQAWHGGMWRMLQDRWPLVLATMMPLLLLALFLLAVALGLASGWAALQGGPQVWPVAAVGLLAAVLAVAYVRHLAQRFAPGWLTRSYAFNMRWVRGEIPEIEPRIQQHAQALLAASERLRGRDDAELLIVAHSSGTILAIAALAQALRWQPELASRVQVSLLTLGQCIPIFGALPQTKAFQEDLRAVAAATGVDWLDFSAPTDGCCFALSDPLPTCGIKRPLAGESQRMRPRLLSPRFAEMFDPPAYKTLRRDKHRMHLQYLMASERLADYDYFQITAGDRRLAERFAAQPDGGDYAGLRLRLGRRATGF